VLLSIRSSHAGRFRPTLPVQDVDGQRLRFLLGRLFHRDHLLLQDLGAVQGRFGVALSLWTATIRTFHTPSRFRQR
jgi:hypothetical protein